MGESVSTAPDPTAFADLSPRTIAAPSDGLVAPDALSGVEAHLAKREYWASETDEGLQAPNRAHDLRSYFDARGVSVEDRDATERTPLVELSLVGLGRTGSITDVPPGAVFHRGEDRTEIVRESLGLVEWFENSSDGLEQGFTLNEQPGPGATVEDGLVLELAVSGARASLARDSVRLASMSGRLLDYGKLAVFDANGLPLSARFELAGEDRIRIRVDDRGATYPIVVDPLISNVSDGGAFSSQGGALLGTSVASAGDVNGDGFGDVIVGAPGFDSGQPDEGMAFLFLGSASGIGSGDETTADAAIESNQAGALLGTSVASGGDVNGDGFADVLIGAPFYDFPDPFFLVDQGVALLFLGSASGIASGDPATAHARIEGDQGTAEPFLVPGPQLGASVASAGDVNGDGRSDVLIGAPRYSIGQESEGAAFLYLGTATGLANGTPATASARFESNQFSSCVGFVAF